MTLITLLNEHNHNYYAKEVAEVIGSLQITVPAGCMNNCSFCIYKQHGSKFVDLYLEDKERWCVEIEKRLRYVAERVDAVMITGQGEPILNLQYIQQVTALLEKVSPNLTHIELQTSGVGLTSEKLDELFATGIRVISLSVPALEKDAIIEIMQVPTSYNYDPFELVKLIKSVGFTLRLSVAMTSWFDDFTIDEVMHKLQVEWAPDQVSFKKLYGAEGLSSKKYDTFVHEFKEDPKNKKLEQLAIGVWKYDSNGIAVVWNDDCMVQYNQEKPRYLILQSDGKLYTRWDSKASLIF